jgi:hypothetical protein
MGLMHRGLGYDLGKKSKIDHVSLKKSHRTNNGLVEVQARGQIPGHVEQSCEITAPEKGVPRKRINRTSQGVKTRTAGSEFDTFSK